MIQWLVTWIILTVSSIPCPGFSSKSLTEEKYRLGRSGIVVSCAVLHTERRTRTETQVFESSSTAKEFVDGMPLEDSFYFGLGDHIIDVKMEQIVKNEK